MKMPEEAREKLAAAIQKMARDRGETYSEIGRNAGVDQSQASKICRGNFKTFSDNVRKICLSLGVDPNSPDAEDPAPDELKRRLERSAVAIWDGTREDAERLIRLLTDIAALRRSEKRRGRQGAE
jgi:transcriptional regulator with XRE-family HTH domain